MTKPAKNVLVFRLWKKLWAAVRTFEFIILFAGDCSVKKFVFPENKSVNDFRVMGGMRGDDAMEPGAPPTCGGLGAPMGAATAAAPAPAPAN